MNVFDILVERGFISQCTNEDAIRDMLNNKSIFFYLGIDPTADSMHIGHLLPVMASMWLKRAGHKPIFVIGGGTARIGDPTGKTELRQMLSSEQIATNISALTEQVNSLVSDSYIINNADWLSGCNYIDFLCNIGRHFSVNKMLTMDSVKLRLEKGLSFLEFNYQLLQAYDFLELYKRYNCILQIGGSDQWGNIIAGIDLIHHVNAEHKKADSVFGLTNPLITTASGLKMGKTVGGAIWLDPNRTSPFEYFQHWLNVDDKDVGKFLRLYTFLSIDRIKELELLVGSDIRDAKRILAYEATKIVHSDVIAMQAEKASLAMSTGDNAEDLPTIEIEKSHSLFVVDLMITSEFASSKNEARNIIRGGGIKVDGQKIEKIDYMLNVSDLATGVTLRFGKKRVARVKYK